MEDKELIWEIMEAFRSIGSEPHLIPIGNINHLRGCKWCIDLENLQNIDTVAIIAQKKPMEKNSNRLLRFEYALRGNIKDIQSDRNIAYTELSFTGFLRKKIKSTRWAILKEIGGRSYHSYGSPPKSGEIWEEGPHYFLLRLLNGDTTLIEDIMDLIKSNQDEVFNIYIDKWGESIRYAYSAWIDEEKAVKLYVSPKYLKIVQCVLGHIKKVRKRFGGLTF
jgi:hypothetical protein